jgi:hypothetical protein
LIGNHVSIVIRLFEIDQLYCYVGMVFAEGHGLTAAHPFGKGLVGGHETDLTYG